MAVLSDTDILARREDKTLVIEPFSEKGLTPNGYDLRIAEVMLPDVDATIHREGVVCIPPGQRFLVSTLERVRMPGDVCAQLWIRSSYARRGIFGAFGKIEAGFEGTLTVGGFNGSAAVVELPVGDRFCQMVLERLETPPRKLYAERSGNYQGQSGITLAREPRSP